nr:hypothetical protein [Nocardioides sp. B-3]
MPEFASLGYLYALDGTELLEDNTFLETPLSSNVFDRQDLRRSAGHRHPRPDVQQIPLRQGRHRLTAGHVGRGRRGGQAAQEQGQGRRPLHQQRRLLHAAVHLRRGRRPGRRRGPGDPGQLRRQRRWHADRTGPDRVGCRRHGRPDGHLRHDDDLLQGGQGRHDHQRPVGDGRRLRTTRTSVASRTRASPQFPPGPRAPVRPSVATTT